jgi:hypothetical protein
MGKGVAVGIRVVHVSRLEIRVPEPTDPVLLTGGWLGHGSHCALTYRPGIIRAPKEVPP